MPSTREITRTEQRIAEVDALQQTIEQLQQDLQMYRDGLRRELDGLQQEPVASEVDDDGLEDQETTPAVDGGGDLGSMEDHVFGDLPDGSDERAAGSSKRSPFELDDMPQGEERIGGKPVSVLISDGSISEEPLSGWVVDRPSGGLKILVDDEIKVGTVIGVRPTREHPHAQWINVSVKSVRPERQSFMLTCQFVERPPWNALTLLNG